MPAAGDARLLPNRARSVVRAQSVVRRVSVAVRFDIRTKRRHIAQGVSWQCFHATHRAG